MANTIPGQGRVKEYVEGLTPKPAGGVSTAVLFKLCTVKYVSRSSRTRPLSPTASVADGGVTVPVFRYVDQDGSLEWPVDDLK